MLIGFKNKQILIFLIVQMFQCLKSEAQSDSETFCSQRDCSLQNVEIHQVLSLVKNPPANEGHK